MNKKTKIAIIGIIALVLVTAGITYAYWLITRTQQGENVITTGCLDISLNGSGDISLSNQFPISDEDGMKLTPYTFTVTNNCNTSVDYQIALEALEAGNEISSNALKVALDDNSKLYSEYGEVATTLSGAYESRVIGYSRLSAKGSEGATDSYELRIWIDENAPISEMNKTFKSKITVTVGQGIESIYEEGSLAYSILANNGGVNAATEIEAPERTQKITSSGEIQKDYDTQYYFGTSYTYNEETGNYALSGDIVQASLNNCRSGSKTCGKYTLFQTKDTAKISKLYEITNFQLYGSDYVTANTIAYVTGEVKIDDSILHKTQDDLGISYYLTGDVTNNYVQFGVMEDEVKTKYAMGPLNSEIIYTYFDTLEECQKTIGTNTSQYGCTEKTETIKGGDMYWRIVRINGDGTIRLIYDGLEKVENGVEHVATINHLVTASSNLPFNSIATDIKHFGYTYNTSESDATQVDSSIKKLVDSWYDKYIKESYGKYIADGIFCNDREVAGYIYYDSNWNETDASSAIYTNILFSMSHTNLSLKCTNKADRYTVNDTINGNGLLINPVGLITAEEVLMAGAIKSNSINYLASNELFWTLSPGELTTVPSSGYSMYTVSRDGTLNTNFLDNNYLGYGARPVINLKANVQFTGNGTIDSPYEIVTQ